ncbi:MAG: hypothetical protein AVDCRST_MAG18-244 [uncultured Thermomicrobiales bacterium]|uniref:Lipoprotein n=1 Tax=uncultured Thermomicrobiales bacterium TaxID=1645740 RepID=A0A6J4UI35_9BACT|nr:MAG: hypothetical protein AVDCRST_MAG18-244 [uncultured Thermomicrobiales bacterium]
MLRHLKIVSASCCAGLVACALAACAPLGETAPTATVLPIARVVTSPTQAATASPITPPTTATVAPPTVTPPAPMATVVPTATATIAPTTIPTTVPPAPTVPSSLAPTATLLVPPTGAPATTATEPRGLCTLTLPVDFVATGGGAYTDANGRVTVTLAGLTAEPDDTLDDVALPYVGTASATIADYRQAQATKGADSLRIDFTGRLAQPGTGTLFLRQFGTTVCALSFFVAGGAEIAYEPTLAQLLASLRATGAVGARPIKVS